VARTVQLGLSRIFRSRWAIALIIAVLVLIVVGSGRLFSNNNGSATPAVNAPATQPTISANPDDDDSVITDDDPPPSPSTKPGTAEPEAVAYAFASAWVNHKNISAKSWYEGLLPNSTKTLAAKLDGVDPAGVPASRIVGRPKLIVIGDNVVQADVTADSGKLVLNLVAPDGHWLVDGIDWDPA
jgi:hypothetical protein